MSDLRISSDDRIELAVSGHVNKISSVLGKRFIVVFRILAGHPLIASDTVECLKKFLSGDAVPVKYPGTRSAVLSKQRKIDVLNAHIFICELFSHLLSVHEDVVETSGSVHGLPAA